MFKFIIALSLLTSCGVKNQPAGTDSKVNDYIDEKTSAVDKKYKANYDKKNSSPDECSVMAVFSLKGIVISQDGLNWGEAIKKAPAGKRLATRGELLLLWDQGYFKNKQFSIDDVWTSTSKNETQAYAVGMVNGELDYTNKYNVLNAVYVDVVQ